MCNNNCCMCCNCNTNTNNEDTPQEITYTSVCNSDACKNTDCCKCCCGKGLCEDDPKVLVYGLSELMEQCCEEVHETIKDISCKIKSINDENKELDDKIDDLYYRESLDFNFAKYNENTHELEFYHKDPENIEDDVQFPESNINLEYFNKAEYIPSEAKIKFYHNDYHFENSDVLLSKGFTNVIFNENTTPRRLEFYYLDQLVCTLNAEPFLFDAWLRDVLLLQDGVTLRFTWNVDPDGQGPHAQTMDVDLTRLLIPITQRLEQEILDRQTADTLERTLRISGDTNLLTQIDATNTTISNLRGSINGYNPELPYDGTAVTVGLIDGKLFKVHLATFPELVLTVSPDYANNRFAVTTNKGNTNYVELKNSTYETKVEAGNHYKEAVISGRRITLTKENGNTTPLDLPEDLLVKQNECTDDIEIPILLAYGANPADGTSAQANYSSSVTVNPHTNVITADLNGNATTATSATNDGNGDNIANTYETIASANNHLTGVTQDVLDEHVLTFTKLSGNPITVTVPDNNNYVTGGSVSGHTLTLTRNGGLSDITVNLPDDNDNNYVTGGSISNGVLTLTRQGLSDITIQLPTDNDNYVTNATVSGHTLTLERTGNLSDLTVTLPDDNNYVTGGSVANNVLTLNRQGLTDVTIQLPTDTNNYVTDAYVTGHTLTLERNGGLSDITVTLPDDDHNYYVTGGSVSGNILTLTRSGGLSDVTVSLPAWTTTDDNNYVTGGSISGNTLTLTRNGGLSDITIQLPNWITTYDNNYVTSATVSGTTLTLTRNGLTDLTCQLPAGADGNNYVTGATFANNTLTLSRNGGLSDVTCSIPIPSTDNDHYPDTMSFNSTTGKLTLSGTNSTFTTLETTIPIPAADNTNPITDVSQSGDTVTFTYKDNTSESITVGGNTNVTYGGSTVTLQQAITSIENRLNALEGLWKKTANNDGLEPVTATHKVYGYGFYDTSVS